MRRRKAKTAPDEDEKSPAHYFIPVTVEIRQAASELGTILDALLSPGENFTIGGAKIKKEIVWCKELVVLKIHAESRNIALTNLSSLGVRKNGVFPSQPEEYYERCRERDNIRRVKAVGAPLSTVLCDSALSPLPLDDPFSLSPGGLYSREYQLNEVFKKAKSDPHSVTVADLNKFWPSSPADVTRDDVLKERYGRDPLEEPASLCNQHDADSEILVFLEHYLPCELAETVRDLSGTRHDACRIDASCVKLLKEFYYCFRDFTITRADLIRSVPELSGVIGDAHGKLFLLAKAIHETAAPELPHKISIVEHGDDLEFRVDGNTVLLTPVQKEVIVALALLGNNRALNVKKFAVLAPAEKSRPDHNFENKIGSLKAVLPRLAFTSVWGGTRVLRNIIFVDVPSDERLEKSLHGVLGSDD